MTRNEKVLLIVLSIIALTIVGYNSFIGSRDRIEKVNTEVNMEEDVEVEGYDEAYIDENEKLKMEWERLEGIETNIEPDVIMIEGKTVVYDGTRYTVSESTVNYNTSE